MQINTRIMPGNDDKQHQFLLTPLCMILILHKLHIKVDDVLLLVLLRVIRVCGCKLSTVWKKIAKTAPLLQSLFKNFLSAVLDVLLRGKTLK